MAFPEKAPNGLIHKSVRLPTYESFFIFLVSLINKTTVWSSVGDPDPVGSKPDPDLVMYIYQIIVSKRCS